MTTMTTLVDGHGGWLVRPAKTDLTGWRDNWSDPPLNRFVGLDWQWRASVRIGS